MDRTMQRIVIFLKEKLVFEVSKSHVGMEMMLRALIICLSLENSSKYTKP